MRPSLFFLCLALCACLLVGSELMAQLKAQTIAVQPKPASELLNAASGSKIEITFTQMGVAVKVPFNKFSAHVNFDPSKPGAASAAFTIEINSFDLGDPEYNKEVLKPMWFDAAKYPLASFASTAVKTLGANRFEVLGQLTIKGKMQEIRVPVLLSSNATHRIFEGQLTISRNAFRIGEGEWQDTSVVHDEVGILVRFVQAIKS